MPQKYFLTTPIYYVNARPHIGHAYTTIVADVLARRHRLLGEDVFFLTGTDEHGQKIERSAAAACIPPQQFADQVSQSFRDLWKRMGITNDDFIRTTEPRHHRAVQKLFQALEANGSIYLDSYTGAYCVSDEAFVDVPVGSPCPDCGRPTEAVTEENYFFRLSHYQQPLLDLIESNTLTIEPESRRNEVLSFLRGGLRDLSISRSSFTWGIPVPRNEQHVIYVWLDALANYMTAVGYGSDDPLDLAKFQRYWPADLHIVGKEIIRFHCIYWPAFLLAANLPLPRKVVAHGWLLFEESKMSKSRGNIVRTETILDAFGPLCPPQPTTVSLKSTASAVPPPASATLKGTASAVPSPTPVEPGASAPEARSLPEPPTTPSPLSSRSEAEGSAFAFPTKAQQDLFAADILRYFLLREIPFGQDGSFSFDAMITRYNADLANGYGNLVSRTLKMISDFSGEIPSHDQWTPITIQVIERVHFGGSIGGVDPDTFFSVPDNELSRISKACTVFYTKAMERLKFSQGVDAEEWRRTLSHEEKIERDILGAIDVTLILIQQSDAYVSKHQPWKLLKSASEADKNKIPEILYTAAESIRIITALLYPILPFATANVWRQLGLDDIELAAQSGELNNLQWGGLKPGTKLGPLSPIFPRADKGLAQTMANLEASQAKPLANVTTQADASTSTATEFPVTSLASELVNNPPEHFPTTDPAAASRTTSIPEPAPGTLVAGSHALTTERTAPESGAPSFESHPKGGVSSEARPSSPADASNQITIDDFAKVELRVAKILVAERIPKADKLLRLEVDLGPEPGMGRRQILSGIAEWYTPEDLLGRRIVVITNLAPRKMRGLESHGMLLAASAPPDAEGKSGKPSLATFPDTDDLPLGSRLK